MQRVCALLLLASSTLAALQCPLGWLGYDTKCYLLEDGKLNFTDAKDSCERQDAFLLQIEDFNEGRFVNENVIKNVDTWLSATGVSGRWTLLSGHPVEYFYWVSSRSRVVRDSLLCMTTLHTEGGRWVETPCDSLERYVCEQPVLQSDALNLTTANKTSSPIDQAEARKIDDDEDQDEDDADNVESGEEKTVDADGVERAYSQYYNPYNTYNNYNPYSSYGSNSYNPYGSYGSNSYGSNVYGSNGYGSNGYGNKGYGGFGGYPFIGGTTTTSALALATGNLGGNNAANAKAINKGFVGFGGTSTTNAIALATGGGGFGANNSANAVAIGRRRRDVLAARSKPTLADNIAAKKDAQIDAVKQQQFDALLTDIIRKLDRVEKIKSAVDPERILSFVNNQQVNSVAIASNSALLGGTATANSLGTAF